VADETTVSCSSQVEIERSTSCPTCRRTWRINLHVYYTKIANRSDHIRMRESRIL